MNLRDRRPPSLGGDCELSEVRDAVLRRSRASARRAAQTYGPRQPSGQLRRGVFAAHPGEPLLSFNVVTSLMPLASATAPQTYKFALAIGLAIPIIAAIVRGCCRSRWPTAAVVVPVVYILYLYDVNEWEDQPVSVVLGAVAGAGVLATIFTLIWRDGILGDASVRRCGVAMRPSTPRPCSSSGLLVPIVSEVLKQVGPIWLATQGPVRRPDRRPHLRYRLGRHVRGRRDDRPATGT